MSVLGNPRHAQAVTPNDTLGLRHPSTYLSFTGTGTTGNATIYVDTVGGEKNVALVLPPGMYPLSVTKVYATGTEADNIVAYWE